MKIYDFDREIDRRGTDCVKHDGMKPFYNRTDLVPLWVADMDFPAADEIVAALQERFDHPVYGYSILPDDYWDVLAAWQMRRHGLKVEKEWMQFVPGIVHGFAYVVNFFTRPGDRIVIQPPVYHPFRLISEGNGREVVENPLREVGHGSEYFYEMDFEGLEEIFATKQPRIMVLCNPHNPGGIQWDEETLRRVGELAARYKVLVISDEIHGDLMLYGRKHVPFASVSREAAMNSLTFGAPSKTFNIPGLVSSWMMIPNEEIRKPFYDWMNVNEFSASTFPAVVATKAAYTHGDEWVDQLVKYIEGNVDAVAQFCEESLPGVRVVKPQSSFLVWLDCRGLGLSVAELEDLFVNRSHLALNTGAMFGTQGAGFMRLNVALPRHQLLAALATLSKALC